MRTPHRRAITWLFVAVHLIAVPTAFACDTCSCQFTPGGRGSEAGSLVTTPTGQTMGRGHGSAGAGLEN